MWTLTSDWPQILAIGIIGKREMTSPECVNTPGPSRHATILSELREESTSEGLLVEPGGPASSGYRERNLTGIWPYEKGPGSTVYAPTVVGAWGQSWMERCELQVLQVATWRSLSPVGENQWDKKCSTCVPRTQ